MQTRVAIILALAWLGCKDKKTDSPAKPPAVAPADAAAKKTLEQELEAIRAENKLPALAAAVW